MSWIESHQALLTHRKTLRAAAKLGVSKYLLIGHLHSLWWWGLDNAKDNGDLGEMMDQEIAEAAGWPNKKAASFVQALAEVNFLDVSSTGYALHNWWRYAGKLNAKRAKDRERKTEGSAEVPRHSTGNPTEVAAKSQAPTNQPNQPTEPTLPNQPNPPDPLRLPARAVVVGFEKCFGRLLSPTELELVRVLEDEQPKERIEFALNEAAALNKRSVRYVQRTCERIANDNGTESGSGVSNARQNPHGVANGVRGLESRSAGIARLGRGGKA